MTAFDPELDYASAHIVQRARRGCWLAHVGFDIDGIDGEEWDAFPTVAAAKDWCEKTLGLRISWQRSPGGLLRWESWDGVNFKEKV